MADTTPDDLGGIPEHLPPPGYTQLFGIPVDVLDQLHKLRDRALDDWDMTLEDCVREDATLRAGLAFPEDPRSVDRARRAATEAWLDALPPHRDENGEYRPDTQDEEEQEKHLRLLSDRLGAFAPPWTPSDVDGFIWRVEHTIELDRESKHYANESLRKASRRRARGLLWRAQTSGRPRIWAAGYRCGLEQYLESPFRSPIPSDIYWAGGRASARYTSERNAADFRRGFEQGIKDAPYAPIGTEAHEARRPGGRDQNDE